MSQVALVELRDAGNSSIVEIAITAEGLEVVSGTKDHLDLNKIDRWIGGVHLTSDAREIWEFDPDAARLVKKKLL